MTKLIDLLRVSDLCGLVLVIYVKGDRDDEPSWAGSYMDVPWCYTDLELEDSCDAIDFRKDLGEKYDHKPGFVISLKG